MHLSSSAHVPHASRKEISGQDFGLKRRSVDAPAHQMIFGQFYALAGLRLMKCMTSNMTPTIRAMWIKPVVTWNAKNPANQRTIRAMAIIASMWLSPCPETSYIEDAGLCHYEHFRIFSYAPDCNGAQCAVFVSSVPLCIPNRACSSGLTLQRRALKLWHVPFHPGRG
jgi:hypothetical protein